MYTPKPPKYRYGTFYVKNMQLQASFIKSHFVKVSRVRRFCKELGIPDNGSMIDLTIRLREHSIKQTEYDRAYEKIFGTSGKFQYIMEILAF